MDGGVKRLFDLSEQLRRRREAILEDAAARKECCETLFRISDAAVRRWEAALAAADGLARSPTRLK